MPLSLLHHSCILLFSRLLLAGVFLFSAQSKLRDVRRFVQIVLAYRILPLSLGRLYGRLLPWLEGALGLWLLLGVAARYASAPAGLLLLSFFAAVALNLLRGRKQLECGCFGGRETLGPATLARELVAVQRELEMVKYQLAHKQERASVCRCEQASEPCLPQTSGVKLEG